MFNRHKYCGNLLIRFWTGKISSSSLRFNTPASSAEYQGVYVLDSTKDDDFPIYFYRGGSSTPNHVLFGGYCWRIIRTTDTGGIKIIYNGVPTEDNQCTSVTGTGTQIGTSSFDGYTSTYGDSAIRVALEAWYFQYLITNQMYLEDTTFCNDNYSDNEIGLSCSSGNSYSLAKGNVSYPVGLITAQEANLCGMSRYDSTYPWLYTGQKYWSMSRVPSNNLRIWDFNAVIGNDVIGGAYGVRPVVSLNSEVVLTDGDGTSANPYHVSLS